VTVILGQGYTGSPSESAKHGEQITKTLEKARRSGRSGTYGATSD
jgi:hypothetical protein